VIGVTQKLFKQPLRFLGLTCTGPAFEKPEGAVNARLLLWGEITLESCNDRTWKNGLDCFCVIGYQAHCSRSVKTATDGRRHRDTYANKKRQRTPTNIGQHRRPSMRAKSS